MNKHTTVTPHGPAQMYSERWEIDHLCNRFGVSRATARTILQSYSGDRKKMEQQAERLGKYEKLH